MNVEEPQIKKAEGPQIKKNPKHQTQKDTLRLARRQTPRSELANVLCDQQQVATARVNQLVVSRRQEERVVSTAFWYQELETLSMRNGYDRVARAVHDCHGTADGRDPVRVVKQHVVKLTEDPPRHIL
jgi:post-segregation antitoxin (ccd killing protein)